MLFIRTGRLFLRPNFPEDWQGVFAALHGADSADGLSEHGWHIARMLARMPWPYAQADAQWFCATPAPTGALHLAITVPQAPGAPLVGQIGIAPLAAGGHELGYWIGRQWQGQGIASEAAMALLETLAALGFKHIAASHFLDNPASARVLHKAGFADTGMVTKIACLARGQDVPARRYTRDLAQRAAA